MGKVKWGVIVAIVAATVVVVLLIQGVFTTGGKSGETADSSETPVKVKPEPDVLEQDMGDTAIADASGDTADTDGGKAAGPGPEPDENELGESEADDGSDRELHEEAETYVRQLAEPSDEPVSMEDAEGFVGADRPLASDAPDSVTPDTTPVEAEELGDVGTTGRDAVEAGAETTLQSESPDPGSQNASQPESVGAGTEIAPDADVRETGPEDVIQPEVDLPLSEQAPVTIAGILGTEEAETSDAVYYVHTVQPDDVQGIWGIVHKGILENFAEGIAVHRGESTETYRVDIPPHADEPGADSTSSFLGRIIYDKTQKSYVYNYQTDRLGRNPDLIVPGQEIVIVSFIPEELIEIYKHFVREMR